MSKKTERKHVDDVTYYDRKMERNKKTLVRKFFRRALTEEFYFAHIEDEIVFPSKLHRTNTDVTDEYVENLYTAFLESPEELSFDNFITRCTRVWHLTESMDSPCMCECSCPCYNERSMCKHVI